MEWELGSTCCLQNLLQCEILQKKSMVCHALKFCFPVQAAIPRDNVTLTGQDSVIDYVTKFATIFDTLSRVKTAQGKDQAHGLKPGDWVYVKNHIPKTSLSPKWKCLFDIILFTPSAVKVKGCKPWIQESHCKKAEVTQ